MNCVDDSTSNAPSYNTKSWIKISADNNENWKVQTTVPRDFKHLAEKPASDPEYKQTG
jgi:hypothetical protein